MHTGRGSFMETAFPDLVGNRALAARLDGEIRSGKLSHAYILAGPAGSGKHTLALRIAMALSCENRKIPGAPLPCMTCPSCRKILSGNSPDYIRVAKDKGRATLGVEAIRFLREDVLIAPNDTDTKIYVIEDAETMTPQAQNALLLTLEEPPQYVLFLLLAANTENLLETVRSRAPVLRMEPIPPADIRACLDRAGKTAGIPEAEMSDILAGADGSIGRALELLHPDKRKPLVEERGYVRRFLGAANAAEYLKLMGDMGNKREDLLRFLSLLGVAVRDLLALRKSDEPTLCFFYTSAEAESVSGRSAQELSALYRAVTEAYDRLSRNANLRLTFTKLGTDAGLL